MQRFQVVKNCVILVRETDPGLRRLSVSLEWVRIDTHCKKKMANGGNKIQGAGHRSGWKHVKSYRD